MMSHFLGCSLGFWWRGCCWGEQRSNHCEGGMMEEWHQKLHNNTSPDDVVICQALLDYIRVGVQHRRVLEDADVRRGHARAPHEVNDKAIHSEPRFVASQRDGLLRDLTNYLRTLKVLIPFPPAPLLAGVLGPPGLSGITGYTP